MRDLVELEQLYPLMAEVFAKGGTFRFYPRGTSMLPMLVAGKDSVELAKADTLEAGDVVFYRRKDGSFVLHRLIVKEKETLTMCGDHQRSLEYGICPEQVLAKLVGFYKGDIYHSVDEKAYMQYAKKMANRFPFYRRNQKLYTFLRKVKHMLIK